jgi:hypothetical protein
MALRQLEQARAGLSEARRVLKQARNLEQTDPVVFAVGWESLTRAHRLMSGILPEAVDEAVLTRQLALQRYATALLVRLRRLYRHQDTDRDVMALGDELLDDEKIEE